MAKEKKGGSPTVVGRQSRRHRRRSRGARGMMNIKAGQAVRVDSTLSAREPHGPQEEAQINTFYARSRDGNGVERGWRKDEPVRMNTGLTRQGGTDSLFHPLYHSSPLFSLSLSLSPFFFSFSLTHLFSLSFLLRAAVIRNIIKLSASSFATIFSFSSAPFFSPP